MRYAVRYYTEVTRHHETEPCGLEPRTYVTLDEAVTVARAALPTIRAKHGEKVGYAIVHSSGVVVHIGPGVYDDV